ncbi:zinc finger protein RFP-like isoform X4 [Lepisosteus oculatus]|uniref:zinc finger protein RFP-like isoform X4 n=1 Tax=Lepisosteus oculatus TaxID=7918 RepID=UPI0037140582
MRHLWIIMLVVILFIFCQAGTLHNGRHQKNMSKTQGIQPEEAVLSWLLPAGVGCVVGLIIAVFFLLVILCCLRRKPSCIRSLPGRGKTKHDVEACEDPKKLEEENEKLQNDKEKLEEENEKLRNDKDILVRRAMKVFVTLDEDTMYPYLMVSEDGRSVWWTEQRQNLPDNPERFDENPCVLGNRLPEMRWGCYWEVEVGNKKSWELGVARDSVCRKGQLSLNPGAGFWVLSLWDGKLTALTDPETPLDTDVLTRVGIHVEYEKDKVSFYNVKEDVYSVIYTFTDKIDRNIRPFFSPGNNDNDPLRIAES